MTPIDVELGGGKHLLYIQTDRFKCEWLSFSFLVPAGTLESRQNAMVLSLSQYGTRSYPTRQEISCRLDELYSTQLSMRNRLLGDMRLLGLEAEFLGARYVGGGNGLLPEIVKLFSEFFLAPHMENGVYTGEALQMMRKAMTDSILAAKKSPRVMARQRCMELLCPGEACVEELDTALTELRHVTAVELTARFLEQSHNASLLFFYVGAAPMDEVRELLEDAFEGLCALPVPYRARLSAHKGAPRSSVLQMPVEQSHLTLGFRSKISYSHPLAPAALLLNEIFGASPASKLFLHVREEMGLCYHCVSSIDLCKGLMLAGAGISADKRAVAESAILAQLEELRCGNITDTELSAAHRSLDLSYRQIYDSPYALSDFYIRRALCGSWEDVEEWRRRLAGVGREEIIQAAELFALGAVSFVEGTGGTGEEE